jgi:hypothetical protein
MNSVPLNDLPSELSTSNDIFEIIAEITETIQREIAKNKIILGRTALFKRIRCLRDRLKIYKFA